MDDEPNCQINAPAQTQGIRLITCSMTPKGCYAPCSAQQAPAKPQAIFRKDYKAPPYIIDTVHLNFNLNEDVTHVHSKLQLKPNYTPNGAAPALTLNGRPDVKLVEVKLAGPSQQLLDSKQAKEQIYCMLQLQHGETRQWQHPSCTGYASVRSKDRSLLRVACAPGLCRQMCKVAAVVPARVLVPVCSTHSTLLDGLLHRPACISLLQVRCCPSLPTR